MKDYMGEFLSAVKQNMVSSEWKADTYTKATS